MSDNILLDVYKQFNIIRPCGEIKWDEIKLDESAAVKLEPLGYPNRPNKRPKTMSKYSKETAQMMFRYLNSKL